jgi:sterol desaturase/sphingolipid hydroxylase (fatty acid hydroxylase superfamily)
MQVIDQGWLTAATVSAEGIAATLAAYPLSQSVWHAVKTLSVVFVIVLILEMVTGGNLRRYLTRNFRTDVAYGIFYIGGIYNSVVYAPVVAVTMILPAWNFRLLDHVPGLLGFAFCWLLSDAAGYWLHRWNRSNPILWEFHKVHHSQTELTFVTSWRNHVVEQLTSNVVPLMVLGMTLWYWAPVYFLQLVCEALQHSDLKWRYGRLYPILLSPMFHAIHHAPDIARQSGNYGKILVWDHLFGTIDACERPTRYGLVDADNLSLHRGGALCFAVAARPTDFGGPGPDSGLASAIAHAVRSLVRN